MSLDFENTSQMQNGNKMCSSLNNFVKNDQPASNKDINQAEEDQFERLKGDAKPVISGQSAFLDSNGNINHEKLFLDRPNCSNLLEFDKGNGKTKVHENKEKFNIAPLNYASENEQLKNVELFHENEVKKLASILSCVVSTDKASTLPYRPMADLLISIGTNAAMLHVCRDIIECLETNPNCELSEDIKISIFKTKEAEKCLTDRFKPYTVPLCTCRCSRKCYSKAELASHKRIGWSTSSSWFRCCFCSRFKTRSATHFVDHLCDVHEVRGTTEPSLKHMCNFCSYENRDLKRTMSHEEKCKSRFILSRNLALLNNDIIIFGRPIVSSTGPSKLSFSKVPSKYSCSMSHSSSVKNAYGSLHTSGNVAHSKFSLQNNPMSASKLVQNILPKSNLLLTDNKVTTSLTQIHDASLSLQAQSPMRFQSRPPPTPITGRPQRLIEEQAKVVNMPGGPSCEICDASVMTLESLLKHMNHIHQINIKSIDFFLRGKAFVCKTCFQGFWTQLGLSRHQQRVHSKQSYPCFICGPIASTDILTHLMIKHNISLQDMLAFGWCYVCKAETKTPDVFINHMVVNHPDLFPSRAALESIILLFKGRKDHEVASRNLLPAVGGASRPSTSKAKSLGPQSSFSRAKHRCYPCQMKFENETQLETHYRILHVVSCTRCNEKWTSVESMMKHFNQRHYAEKDPCILCKEMVKIGVPMIRHMKRVHLKKCIVIMKRLSPSQRMKYIQLSKRPTNLNESNLHLCSSIQPKVVIENCNLLSN